MSIRFPHAIAAAALLATGAAQAVTVSVFNPGTSSISAIGFTQVGNVLNIDTTWSASAGAFLLFDGLSSGQNYTVNLSLANNSGSNWTRVANELLDPSGDQDDKDRDPKPQPAFVPGDFSTSSDFDGLSFAQGSGLARTSTAFGSVLADELSDSRDFLDFFNGNLADGATDTLMTFGLRDNSDNQPFLLAIRPNAFSVPAIPEPETYALMAMGLVAVGFAARRRKAAGKA